MRVLKFVDTPYFGFVFFSAILVCTRQPWRFLAVRSDPSAPLSTTAAALSTPLPTSPHFTEITSTCPTPAGLPEVNLKLVFSVGFFNWVNFIKALSLRFFASCSKNCFTIYVTEGLDFQWRIGRRSHYQAIPILLKITNHCFNVAIITLLIWSIKKPLWLCNNHLVWNKQS